MADATKQVTLQVSRKELSDIISALDMYQRHVKDVCRDRDDDRFTDQIDYFGELKTRFKNVLIDTN